MKIGLVGLPLSGKKTVFEALTGFRSDPSKQAEPRFAAVDVPDERLDALSRLYRPRRTIYAKVEYFLPGIQEGKKGEVTEEAQFQPVRTCDALIQVVRNFELPGLEPPDPVRDIRKLASALLFADFLVVEKRLERLELDRKKGRGIDTEEYELLVRARSLLESEVPLRRDPNLAGASKLKGYTFLTAKPFLVVINNREEDEALPELGEITETEVTLVLRGRIEQELVRMEAEEAREFLSEYGIVEPARHRVLKESLRAMGLITFFTVGEDEVRAWPIRKGTVALDAAEVIHSDIKKGFIRAEVVPYEVLIAAGSFAEARKRGGVRLEGREYVIQDGDIVHFRFNI